jgi:hypothetical protein
LDFTFSQQADGSALISLAGPLNEDSDNNLKAILEKLSSIRKVTFDFAGVKNINSLGVRAWVTFLRKAEEGRSIIFTQCVPDVIMQINMIPSFQASAKIESYHLKYVCDNCRHEHTAVIETSQLPPKTIPKPLACQKCGTTMETEELEDEYFVFLMR